MIWTLLLVPLVMMAQLSSTLSDEEKAWINAQKEITIGAMNSWEPLNFVNYRGKASGIGAEIVEELNKKLDGKLKIVSSNWNDIYEKSKKGELHAIMDITPKPEREAFFNFTKTYLQIPHVIVSRKDQQAFLTLDMLRGKSVALEKNIGTISYFKEKYPEILIKTYDDTSMALHALSAGEVDAYVGNRAVVTYQMAQEFFSTLKIDALDNSRKGVPLTIGVSKHHPHFYSILQKTLDEFSHPKLLEILSKWSSEKPVGIELTVEEKHYLREKKELHFVAGNEQWAPFSFIDSKGEEKGLEIDFIRLLESKLNIPISISYLPWPKAVQSAKEHLYDGIIFASPAPERKKDLSFSSAYYLSPLALITQQQHPLIEKPEEFIGKRIALTEGSAFEEYVKELFPSCTIIYAKEGPKEALKMVLKGEADAAIDNLPPAQYVLETEKLDKKLKVSLTLYSETLSSFQYGLRNDEPLLLSSINKALASYSTKEKQEIKERWEGVHSKPRPVEMKQATLSIQLTPQEKAWIKSHPTISVSNEPDLPPFDFMQNGKAVGLGIDYVTLIASKVGLHVNFVQAY